MERRRKGYLRLAAVFALSAALVSVMVVANPATASDGAEKIVLPNGLAFDSRGNLYVADSRLGAIWRIRPGGTAQMWLQDELLEGNGSIGLFIGANGIAYRHGSLFVTNTEKFDLLRIKVHPDGSPGEPAVIANFEPGAAPDGLAV